MESKGKATLTYGEGKSIDFPVFSGSVGPDVIDIRTLYGKTGMFTYDPGFLSTASCSSKITYIDGDQGVLLYRGYPIEQLAQHSDFMEVCYLLMNGELPNKKQKAQFNATVINHTMVHEQLARFFSGFRRDSHPMAVMVGVVGALAAFYHDSLDIANAQHREISAFRLHRRGHCLPMGPGARRRQRGLPQHAGGNRRRVARSRVHQEGQGQE